METYGADNDPVFEIVGESGTKTGEGCLQEVAVALVAVLALVLLLGAAVVAFG